MTNWNYGLGFVFDTFNSFKQFYKLGILKPGFKKTKLTRTRKFLADFMPVQSSCIFYYIYQGCSFSCHGPKRPKGLKLCVLDRLSGPPFTPPPA